jgi:hypothetical protein
MTFQGNFVKKGFNKKTIRLEGFSHIKSRSFFQTGATWMIFFEDLGEKLTEGSAI